MGAYAPKITGIECQYLALSFARRDFSRFSESFNIIFTSLPQGLSFINYSTVCSGSFLQTGKPLPLRHSLRFSFYT